MKAMEIGKGMLVGILFLIVGSLLFSVSQYIVRIQVSFFVPFIVFALVMLYFRKRRYFCLGIAIAYVIILSIFFLALAAYQHPVTF